MNEIEKASEFIELYIQVKETTKNYSYPTKIKPTEKKLFELYILKKEQRTRRDMSNGSLNVG